MCLSCWKEAGEPKIANAKVYAIAFLVDRLYEFAGSGGNLHIVTDDWNVEDSHIEYCMRTQTDEHFKEYMGEPEIKELLHIEKEIAKYMLECTIEERYSALAKQERMW